MSREIGMMPIRVGCYCEFIRTYSTGAQDLIRGHVISSEYIPEGHQFIVQHVSNPKWKIEVSGKNLYGSLQYHEPGEQSIIEHKRAIRKGQKLKKLRREKGKKRAKRSWN